MADNERTRPRGERRGRRRPHRQRRPPEHRRPERGAQRRGARRPGRALARGARGADQERRARRRRDRGHARVARRGGPARRAARRARGEAGRRVRWRRRVGLTRLGGRRVTAPARAAQRHLRRGVQVAHLPRVSLRPSRRGRVHRHLQVVRALRHPARAEHGPARGDGVDDPRPVRVPASRSASSTWWGCCTPTRATSSCTASRCPTCPTTTCSTCARSSGCCSRTARCSAR